MQREIKIKIKDEELKGRYANFMRVFHNKEEFVLDFGNVFPEGGIISARIITSPVHFKRMVRVLEENLKRYEENFGKIESSKREEKDFGFALED